MQFQVQIINTSNINNYYYIGFASNTDLSSSYGDNSNKCYNNCKGNYCLKIGNNETDCIVYAGLNVIDFE